MGGLFSFFQGGLDQVSSFLKTPWDPKASPGRIQTSPPSEELLVASGPSNRNELHHESCWDIAHTCVRISKQFRISKSKKVSKHAVRGKEGPILWWAPSDANEGGVNEAILRLPCKQLHHQCQTKQLQYIYIYIYACTQHLCATKVTKECIISTIMPPACLAASYTMTVLQWLQWLQRFSAARPSPPKRSAPDPVLKPPMCWGCFQGPTSPSGPSTAEVADVSHRPQV